MKVKTAFVMSVTASVVAHSQASVAAPAAAAPATSEAQRVRDYLDSLYRPSDVKHSFHTKFNETVDCVDYFAQPGAKSLAARGKPLTVLPPPRPRPPKLPDYAFDGSPDDQGNARSCPNGSVPLLRLGASDIAKYGSLDAFKAAGRKTAGPRLDPVRGATFLADTAAGAPPDDGAGPNYAHVYTEADGNIQGGFAELTVWSPSPLYIDTGNHSIGQVWMLGSGNNGLETVEAGWTVDPYVNDRYGNGNQPHFFVFATNNDYQGTYGGCYNIAPGCPPTFTVENGAWLTPGMLLSSGTVGGRQSYLDLEVYWGEDSSSGIWAWIIAGAGFYDDFTGPFQPVEDSPYWPQTVGTAFQAGGEVYDNTETWVFPMGSGSVPWKGDAYTASVSNLWVLTEGAATWTTAGFSPVVSTRSDYGFVEVQNGVINGDNTSGFYYGDNPKVWWGQDYGMVWSPFPDWDRGYNKGECGFGQPVIAISNDPSDHNAHAILCNESVVSGTNSNGCTGVFLNGVDNRQDGDGGWDWDRGYVKAECAPNQYAQGVAQDPGSGLFTGLLCCPSSQISHSSCQAQTFYSSDSPGESGLPDWDPGYLKGHCPAGWFVEGASQGTSGGIRSLLCCH